jgi:hypothetical protein
MIHKFEIDDTVTFEELKREFRKKLMTGGAVVRLRSGLTPEQCERIRAEFEPHCNNFGIADEVIRELSKLA